MFLVGDAPPHMDYAQDTKYPVTLTVAQAEGHHRQRGAGRRRARHRAGVARHRPERQRPLHPDPAGRRPGRHHRDAVRRGHHHPAARDQRHRDPLRAARSCRSAPRTRPSNCPRSRPPRRRRPPRWRAISTSAPRRRRKPSPATATSSPTSLPAAASFPAIKEEDLPDNLRAMKPEQRMRRSQQADEPAQGAQRKARRRWWRSATNTSPTSAPRRRRKRRRSTAWSRIR